MPIILPDNPLPAERVNPKFMLLYGPRKVGKTTTLAKLKDNLIVDLEDGTDYVSALKYKIGVGRTPRTMEEFESSYKDFKDFNLELCKHKPRKYKYVTYDTIDILQDWSLFLACKLYKESPIGKNFEIEKNNYTVEGLPNGAGYLWIRRAFTEILQYTYPVADHIIYVGHVRDKNIESVGTNVSSKDLDLIGKNKAIICQTCDTVGHIFRERIGTSAESRLGIDFRSTEQVLCSSRVPHVTGKVIYFDDKNGWEQIYK